MAVSVGVHLLADGCDRVGRFVWVDHSPRFFATPDWTLGLFGDLRPAAFDDVLADLRHDRIAVIWLTVQSCLVRCGFRPRRSRGMPDPRSRLTFSFFKSVRPRRHRTPSRGLNFGLSRPITGRSR